MSISFVLITKNEEAWISNCLESIKGLGEIVVVDDGSTDKTVRMCKTYGARVFVHHWEGFSKTKNYGLVQATGDWVFFIDADERVSKELKRKINEIIKANDQARSYYVARQNILLGKKVKHGGWFPDFVLRFAPRKQIVGWKGDLHESLEVIGEKEYLVEALFHLSHRGIQWMLAKSLRYTPIEARLRYDASHPPVTWWRLIKVMIAEFIDRFGVKSGWKDGMVGLIESLSQAYNMFLIYAQLWEMQKGKPMDEIYKEIDEGLAKNGF